MACASASKRFRSSPAQRPTCSCCRLARCAPMLSNPVSSCSSTSAKRSCITSRVCSSSIAVWKSGSRGSIRGPRSRIGRARVRRRAAWRMRSPIAKRWRLRRIASFRHAREFLRVLLAEMERLYNHLHYFGHLCHTTTLKVGEAEGKLLEERAKQLNTRLTGSRFLRSILALGGLRRDLSPKDLAWCRTRSVARGFCRLCAAYGKYRTVISTG